MVILSCTLDEMGIQINRFLLRAQGIAPNIVFFTSQTVQMCFSYFPTKKTYIYCGYSTEVRLIWVLFHVYSIEEPH